MSIRVRFAPSPTGHLHVGNVRTALYNWLFARQSGGTFILRIEDTDLARSEKRYEEQLLEDLTWLGFDWDEGLNKGGDFGPYRQTDRLDLYREHAERLMHSGAAYYCFCTQEELERQRELQMASKQQPRYSGKCRDLPAEDSRRRVEAGEAATLRLRVRPGKVGFNDIVFGPIEVDCSVIGDFILVRSGGTAQYNFAVVVDDLLMEVSHVIRGEGHISNTHRQLLVYEALGCEPPQFAHLSTILGKDGSKLSKRHGATSIDEFKKQGYLPRALVNYLALLGWAPKEEGREILQVAELVEEFDLSRVNRHPAVFDSGKLKWVNRSHLKEETPDGLARLALPYLQGQGWIGPDLDEDVSQWLGEVVQAVLEYLDTMEDVVDATRLVFDFNPERDLSEDEESRAVLSEPGANEVIRCFLETMGPEPLDLEAFRATLKQVKSVTGKKGKSLFHPVRVALTARSSGPELNKLVPIFEQGMHLPTGKQVLGVRQRMELVLALTQ